MGYIYARLIERKAWSPKDVNKKYVKATIDAYYDLFGERLSEEDFK